ncbi:MAG TPA: periplasmic heavy metal sensor [Pyrinomonadaceae bacterium]
MTTLSPKFLIIGLLMLCVPPVLAQGGPPPGPEEASDFVERPARPNLLEALGLTQDQVRQIRLMNRDRKPLMEAAQTRLREANRALDMAIYGDTLDEAEVQARLAAFQQAQAEVASIRFQSEVQLRKILTPDQLVKFRMLRARLARARENFRQRRQPPPGERPLNRIRQLPNRGRVN